MSKYKGDFLQKSMNEEIKKILNEKNLALAEEIEKLIPLDFIKRENADSYGSITRKDEDGNPKSAEIFYKEPLDQAKFAHELLHMKADAIVGDNYRLYVLTLNNPILQSVLDKKFCEDLLNVSQHIMFKQDIIDLGYTIAEQFERESVSQRLMFAHNYILRNKLKVTDKYHVYNIQTYIKLLVSYLFYPDKNRFVKEINEIKLIDKRLFSVVSQLRNEIGNVKIVPKYKPIVSKIYVDFGLAIQKWLHDNRVGEFIF